MSSLRAIDLLFPPRCTISATCISRGVKCWIELLPAKLSVCLPVLVSRASSPISLLISCPRGEPYRRNLELYKDRFSMEAQADKMLIFFQATIDRKREISGNGLSG